MMNQKNINIELRREDELTALIQSMPKIELHAHLNGCIKEATLFALARERGITLSEHHFSENDNDGHMYNSDPRSLVECFEVFEQVKLVVSDLVALRQITREALEDFASHHVAYLELRTTPKQLKRSPNSEGLTNKLEYINVILSVMQEFEIEEQQRYQREVQDADATRLCRLPLMPRLLISIDRAKSIQEAEENVDIAVGLHERRNRHIVGVDLGGNPLCNDFRDFEHVLQKARTSGLKLTLHCGEVPCANSETDVNTQQVKALEEAKALLSFRPDRLGHGLLLPESLRASLSDIPVESCPTSNVMTLELAHHVHGHLVEGLRTHPQLGYWLKTKYPFSVSTDDPGVFNTNPSKELLLLALAWELDFSDLRRLVLNSVEHCFCDDRTKKLLTKQMKLHMDKVAVDAETLTANSR
jgi:adenosine deaminase